MVILMESTCGFSAAAQLFRNGRVNLLLHGKQAGNSAIDVVQLLGRRPAGFVVPVVGGHAGKVKQTAHPHHKEFVQIAGENGDEFQPLQGRDSRVGCLLQHAPVKAQPAQLPILGISVSLLRIFWHRYPSRTPYLLMTSCWAWNRWNVCCKTSSPGIKV